MNRRKFMQVTATATLASSFTSQTLFAQSQVTRKFKIALNPGIIGVKANFAETLDYAIQYGYEAISPFTQEIMRDYSAGQLNEMLSKMEAHSISYDSINIPVEYRKDEATFKEDLKGLKAFCQTMEKQKADRINTWIISSHSELTYNENMRQHALRLGECAKVMQDHGIRLGIEYLGTRPMVIANRYPFISTLKEGRELIGHIGLNNVGLVLDTFHWYCAGETKEDLLTLSKKEVFLVDINDAREGFERKEQQDGKRELPMATGLIPIQEFMEALLELEYDGPLRTEPFNQALNDLDNDSALKANMDAIQKTLSVVGL